MTFIIRPVEKADRESVTALLRENYQCDDEDLIQGRVRHQIGTSLDQHIPHKLFLAVADGTPVALAFVIADKKRGGFLVDDLYTRKDYEGRGIASALLTACEDFVRELGEKEIHLNVVTTNPALQKFYEKRGWMKQMFDHAIEGTEIGEKTDIDPHTPVPTHLLKKSLG